MIEESGFDSYNSRVIDKIMADEIKTVQCSTPSTPSTPSILSSPFSSSRAKPEPFESPEMERFEILPPVYPHLWNLYLKHAAAHWVDTEVRYREDLPDWENKLSQNERNYIKKILAFFSGSDLLVNKKEEKSKITVPEVKYFIANKIDRENVHTLTYQGHIHALIPEKKERESLFNSVKNDPSIRAKADWFMKYVNDDMDDGYDLARREMSGAITEGIFFSGSFCSIFWLKKRGLMPALCFSNELISKDEGAHCDFSCTLYRNHIVNQLPVDVVYSAIEDAVDLESRFIHDALPEDLIGMNSYLMTKYIKHVSNRLTKNLLGTKKLLYEVENPFPWMAFIGSDVKTNFFDTSVGAYADTTKLSSENENNFHFDLLGKVN